MALYLAFCAILESLAPEKMLVVKQLAKIKSWHFLGREQV